MSATLPLETPLKTYFGYNAFRPHQKEIVSAILDKKDCVAILPTGSGKSLCYQLPAILSKGLTVVVSPLIALMQDQVEELDRLGIRSAYFNSSLSPQEKHTILNTSHTLDLLYVSPERFEDTSFIQFLSSLNLSCFVIDEAHCISQWGHAFRPHYRQLSQLKVLFPNTPIAAFTATATADVKGDIITQLNLRHPLVFESSFDRPNLTIRVYERYDGTKQLHDFLKKHPQESGIVYTSTRKMADQLYQELNAEGIVCEKYHAGMTDLQRQSAQRRFIKDDVSLMIATIAFGMGIHKPDVRFVVHMQMPKTMESYYQEIGRAGRDGLPAACYMLYSIQDVILQKRLSEDIVDDGIRHHLKRKTEQLFAFCGSTACRRIDLLRYFGETYPHLTCSNCDNCLDDVDTIDGTVIAQKILSCVYRLDQRWGISHVIDVLTGSKKQTLLAQGHDKLSTYGLLSDLPKQAIRYYIFSLINQGHLIVSDGEYPLLKLTPDSREVLRGEKTVAFRQKHFKADKPKKLKATDTFVTFDRGLFVHLKALRKRIADENRIPPYLVFSDKSLQDMAAHLPKTEQAFATINGVGPHKLKTYGTMFMQAIADYLENEAQ